MFGSKRWCYYLSRKARNVYQPLFSASGWECYQGITHWHCLHEGEMVAGLHTGHQHRSIRIGKKGIGEKFQHWQKTQQWRQCETQNLAWQGYARFLVGWLVLWLKWLQTRPWLAPPMFSNLSSWLPTSQGTFSFHSDWAVLQQGKNVWKMKGYWSKEKGAQMHPVPGSLPFQWTGTILQHWKQNTTWKRMQLNQLT